MTPKSMFDRNVANFSNSPPTHAQPLHDLLRSPSPPTHRPVLPSISLTMPSPTSPLPSPPSRLEPSTSTPTLTQKFDPYEISTRDSTRT